MTKRFTLEDDHIYDYDMRLCMRGIVERLNDLYEAEKYYGERCEELRKENKQLKNRASSWEMTASNDRLEKQELLKQVDSLIKENQHLQQDVKDSETKNAYIIGITLIAITIILLLLLY